MLMRVQDRAHEFRIVLVGELAGEAVRKLTDIWAAALGESVQRRMVVDITEVTGWDSEGRKLLRDMHAHGTDLAAKTPGSLALLAEATSERRPIVSVLPAPSPGRVALKAVAGC